jgi:hypothetical protein
MSNKLSEQILHWLSIVLEERFDVSCKLQYEEEHLCLCFGSGALGKVIFDVHEPSFRESVSSFGCEYWDGKTEGWNTAYDQPLPAPSSQPLDSPLIEQNPNGYTIHYDLPGLMFWVLTRYEEIGRTDLDEHNRFPASSSHAFLHGYLERPIIDEWLDILRQVIERTWPKLDLKTHHFSIKVSHDVDSPSRYGFVSPKNLLRRMGGDVLKRGNVRSSLLGLWINIHTRSALHKADSYNTFEYLMGLSEKYNLDSAFYFICGSSGDKSFNADYSIDHPVIRKLMRDIHNRGHEIGLHPSYGTFLKPELIQQEYQHLRKVADEEGIIQDIWGGRMHYLRWQQPTTMQAWDDAGLDYDTTLSYADHAGFRCGTCFEYPAFNPITNQMLHLRIRPLIVMEGSVLGDSYMSLTNGEKALEKMTELKNRCRQVQGCFTLLWHNSSLQTKKLKKLYESILEA